jgi:hypothetical protein
VIQSVERQQLVDGGVPRSAVAPVRGRGRTSLWRRGEVERAGGG